GFAILLEDEGVLDRCSIYATDFNEDMLAVARMGSYPLERIRRYEDAYRTSGGRGSLADHYSVAGRSARFDRRLARSVTWAKHNLATDGSFNDFHLIVCANVLIYFRESLQERAHRLIYDSLIRGGFLALGKRRRPAPAVAVRVRGGAARRAHADHGRLRDRAADPAAAALRAHAHHLRDRPRPGRDRHGTRLQPRGRGLRLRADRARDHARQGQRLRRAVPRAAGAAPLPDAAGDAGRGADDRADGHQPRARGVQLPRVP